MRSLIAALAMTAGSVAFQLTLLAGKLNRFTWLAPYLWAACAIFWLIWISTHKSVHAFAIHLRTFWYEPKKSANDWTPEETPKLIIHRAVYGAGPQAESLVTDKLQNMPRHALVIPVDNNLVPTDPAWGVRKQLDVEYSYGSDTVLRVSRLEPLAGEISRLVLPEDTEIPRLKDEIARLTQQVADQAALSQDDPLCKELKAIAESDARKITERVRHNTKRIDFDYSLASDSHLDVIIELLNMSVFEITTSGRIDGHTRYGGQQLYGNPEAHNEPDLPGPTFVRMEHGEYGTIRIRQFLSPQVAEQMWINKGRGIAIDMSFVGVAFRTHLDGMPDRDFRIFGPRFTMDDVVRV